MSGPWLARPTGWDLGRAGLGARVAGAHLAVPRFDGTDAGKRLVFGAVPGETMAFLLEPSSQCCAGHVDSSGRRAMGPQVHVCVRNEALLGDVAYDYR